MIKLSEQRVTIPAGWSLADLHVHTNLSDGIASPEQVVDEAIRRNLSVIAITDHDSLAGAKRVREVVAKRQAPLEVIVGTEVTTRSGHFIGLFLEKRIKMYRSVDFSYDAIKEQGGICIVPHPWASWYRVSVVPSSIASSRRDRNSMVSSSTILHRPMRRFVKPCNV